MLTAPLGLLLLYKLKLVSSARQKIMLEVCTRRSTTLQLMSPYAILMNSTELNCRHTHAR